MTTTIKIEKSVYDRKEASDGKRILVMRFWPRGIPKDKVDLWMKELGTGKDLIKKWKAGKISWDDFSAEYIRGLKSKEHLLKDLARQAKEGAITLLCGCKDMNHCHRYLLKNTIAEYFPRIR